MLRLSAGPFKAPLHLNPIRQSYPTPTISVITPNPAMSTTGIINPEYQSVTFSYDISLRSHPLNLPSDESERLSATLKFTIPDNDISNTANKLSKTLQRRPLMLTYQTLSWNTYNDNRNSINTNINKLTGQSFYKVSEIADNVKEIERLKRRSVDVLKRSMRVFSEINDNKPIDIRNWQCVSLSSSKGDLYRNKAIKYECNRNLELSGKISRLKTSQIIEKLKSYDAKFDQMHKEHINKTDDSQNLNNKINTLNDDTNKIHKSRFLITNDQELFRRPFINELHLHDNKY